MSKSNRRAHHEARVFAASLIGDLHTRDRGGWFFRSFLVQQCVDAILASPRSDDEWQALQKCSIAMQHKLSIFANPVTHSSAQQTSLISALRAHFDSMGEPKQPNPMSVRLFLMQYESPFRKLPGWVFRAIVVHLHPDPLVKMVYAGGLDASAEQKR